MMPALTSGKLVNLQRLTDAAGRFKMLAIDQRDSLRSALAKATGAAPKDVAYGGGRGAVRRIRGRRGRSRS